MIEGVFLGHAGERIVYRPTGETFNVKPLGFQELVAGVTSDAPKFQVEFSDVEIRESSVGPIPEGPVTFNKTFTHRGRVEVFGMVLGGWMPLPWAHKKTAWVDRNIIRELAKFLSKGSRPPWADEGLGLGQDVNRVSSVLYAMEAGLQRKPTFDEMNAALDEGDELLRAVLPMWQVEGLSDLMQRALYQEVERLSEVAERTRELLAFGGPLVSQPVSKTRWRHIEGQLLKKARDTKASQLATIALLSCLYDNKPNLPRLKVYRPGRAVLKPADLGSSEGVYNAMADLSHVEMMLGAIAVLPNYQPVLYTRDLGLAAFWAALAPNSPSVVPGSAPGLLAPRWNLQLAPTLFPALSFKECAGVVQRLRDL